MPAPKVTTKGLKQDIRVISNLTSLFFIAIMAVFPLYITDSWYVLIIRNKTNFFYAVTAVFAALAIPFFISSRFQLKDYFVKDEPRRGVALHEWALLAFIGLTLLSSIFSAYQDTVWTGFYLPGAGGRYEGFWAFLCYIATFFFISRFYRPKSFHLFIAAGAAVIVSLYCVFQFAGWDFLSLFPFTVNDPRFIDAAGNQIYGPLSAYYRTTLGNTNVVAAYCSIAITLFTALFSNEDSKWGYLYLAASCLSFAMLIISNGDAGKVSVLAAMVLLIPYWLSNRKRLGRILITLSGWSAVYALYHGYLTVYKSRADIEALPVGDRAFLVAYSPQNLIPFVVLAAVLLAAGLLLIFIVKKWPEKRAQIAGTAFLGAAVLGGLLFVEIMGRRFADRPGNIVFEAREILHGNLDDSYGSGRGWVWKRGLSVIPDNPMLGTGPDTFYYALGEELQQEAVAQYNVTFDKAHNTFIQIAVCLGVPALLAFLTFLAGLFVPAVKRIFKRPLLAAFAAAAFAYLVQSFFEVDMPIDKPFLWAALGVMGGELWRDKAGA
ncbi:MAG: O-antigen ligase family protein [Clostridiales bacterium]|jgi:O-antigen ligase|nr:O-antigen ligase family protein [Clostridiales bacterium]